MRTVTIALATDAFGSGAGGDYRTAVVANHPVASLLTGVATIEPVSQATVAFPVAGTVAAVNVKVGDHVAPEVGAPVVSRLYELTVGAVTAM